jgi:AraC-like DNA-binding protein
MGKFNAETEKRITEDICAMQFQRKPNISKTAREFRVNRTTLQSRWQGRPSLKNRPPTNLKLDQAQDKTLCQYLETLETYRVKPLKRMIEAAANAILKVSHTDSTTPPPTVGPKWLQRWLVRHPRLK